ncbi:MAG: TIGR00270 family protein [Candidatus Aenigmarchaeota archaeon]|nr:TIGR00270 family protein [Candidatus Aenigmarchaeota archaeon]
MECELCGRSNAGAKAEVEGTLLNVCESCARLGRRIDPIGFGVSEKRPKNVSVSSMNPEFASVIINARKKSGLSLEGLGKRISEKASVLERVEKGMRPTDSLARKLEKALKIKLLGYEED